MHHHPSECRLAAHTKIDLILSTAPGEKVAPGAALRLSYAGLLLFVYFLICRLRTGWWHLLCT